MTVLLSVLKILGVILGVALVVSLYYLFSPLFFIVCIDKKDSLFVDFKINSPVKFLQAGFNYDGKFCYKVSALWNLITIVSSERKSKKVSVKPEESSDDNDKKSILDMISFFIKSRKAFRVIFKTISGKIIKRTHIKIIEANLSFSTGECDKTAFYYGLLMTVPGALKDEVVITPDINSQEAFYTGDAVLKGRISLITIAVNLIKLFLNKDFISIFEQGENNNE